MTTFELRTWTSLVCLGDVLAAGSMLDRFLHHARIVAINGRSYRIKDSPLRRAGHLPSEASSIGAAEGAS